MINTNIDIQQKIFLRQGVEHTLEVMMEQGKISIYDILEDGTVIKEYMLEDAYVKNNRLMMRCDFV